MIGTGYVGLVSGVCFADLGNDVICVDKDLKKIDSLSKGNIPIYEPGLTELVIKNFKNKRLRFSNNLKKSIKDSDIISFHCKPNKDGNPIMNKNHLSLMKKNCIIINTARGNLVDENDLKNALEKKEIKGAALDVFKNEPLEKSGFYNLDNIILTPHIAASTDEAQIVVAEMVANQFVEFFNNNKIINSVT